MNVLGTIAIVALVGFSMVACDLGDSECDVCTNFDQWSVAVPADITEDGEEVRICLDCGKEETRPIPALNTPYRGTWTNTAAGGGTTHTIVISNTEFKITTSGGADHFTISNAVWTAVTNGPTGSTNGYQITGTVTQSGTSWPATNTSASIYLNTSGNELRWRLTDQIQSRVFTKN